MCVAMDIVREKSSPRRKYIIVSLAVVGALALTISVSRLESRPPSVERSSLWIDSVRRGTMLRQVRAPGTLVPEHIRIISALTAGRVESLPIRPGVVVAPTTVLLTLTNPDVQLQWLEAQRQLSITKASLVTLKTTLEQQRLTQSEAVAQAEADCNEAVRNAAVFEALDKKGFSGANELHRTHDMAVAAQTRLTVERERLRVLTASVSEQLALQAEQVDRLSAIAQFQQANVESMHVTAGEPGVLEELPMELGQWVTPGTILARVAQPGKLKAVLRVPETQAKDVVPGQVVAVDTRNGIIPGSVTRIEPSVQNGTVGVDVALEGALPSGARADLSVDGTIEIERLTNVLYVGRPAFGQAGGTITLFKILPDGRTAARTTVTLGRSSVTTVEVQHGLEAGDKVIISDMSTWDNVNKVRVE
jgi:multidrug resistance efflux pump